MFFEGGTPVRLTVALLTDTTMTLLLDPAAYLQYSPLADDWPEGMQLAYSFTRQ